MGKEIERKFLINTLPTDLKEVDRLEMYQAYLSVKPEIRVRSVKSLVFANKGVEYYLAFKSDGTLTREEVEMNIDSDGYDNLSAMIPYSSIYKILYKYALPGGLILECADVDRHRDSHFMYAEIEFPDEKAAKAFFPSFKYIKEVTYDKSYKMKNYWNRTRVHAATNKECTVGQVNVFSSTETIDIHYYNEETARLHYNEGTKSNWIDLSAAETVVLKKDEYKLIPLGFSMKLPEGYEALIIPRSSTFKNFGIIQANSIGLVDESYCGTGDEWLFSALAMRDTVINKGERICQFRIIKHQPIIEFNEVDKLDDIDRGGFGTTGVD